MRQQLPAWVLAATPDQQRRLDRHERQVQALEQALSAELGANASLLAYSDAHMAAALKPLVDEALDPALLMVTTQREVMAGKLTCQWTRSVSAIAAYGLPAGDETAGSAFLARSTLTYDGEPLPSHLTMLTPERLAKVLAPLQLRVDFHHAQASLWTDARQATLGQLLLARADASAYAALLRGDLSTQDQAAWKAALNAKAGKCQTVVLDNAPAIGQGAVRPRAVLQLNGLMVVRHRPAEASADSFLLYAADAPGERQWWGGLDEAALEAMLTGWCGTSWLKAQIAEHDQEALAMALREPRWVRWDAPTPQRLFQLRAQWQAGRQQALQHYLNPAWYINAPLAKRRELLRRETSLQLLREHVQASLPIPAFQLFARDKAAALLATLLGEEADPDTVLLTAFSRTCTFTELVITGLQRAFEPPFDLTLIAPDELGYVHRPEHARQVSASGPAGLDLSPLTWERLEKDVDGQWLADQYAAHVQTQLLDASAAGYAERRALYAEMARQDFQRAALAGALQGGLAAGQQALVEQFAQPPGESDDWVELFSLQFEVGSLVNVHKYPWLNLLPRGQRSHETIEGLWVFKEGDQSLVYTPGAPDGLEFRPLSGMARALRRQDMTDYLLARLRVKMQDWMTYQLRAVGDGAAPGPQASALPVANLHEAFYDQHVRQALARVAESHVGQAQALRERIERALFAVELVLMVATLPFPPAAFALGTLFAFKDLALAIDAQQRGDKDAVPGHALGAALNALGALGDLAVGAKGAGAWLRLARNRQEKRAALLPVDLRIDRSFALKQAPAPLEAVTNGLFAGTWRKDGPGFSSSYIRDEAGRWFRVQRATDRTPLEVLRVVSEHGERHGHAVHLTASGLWRRQATGTGLAGGLDDVPERLQEALDALSDDELMRYFLVTADDLADFRRRDAVALQVVWGLCTDSPSGLLLQHLRTYLASNGRFPPWGEALDGLNRVPLDVVRDVFANCTPAEWQLFRNQFRFPETPHLFESVLALEIKRLRGTPEWLVPYARDAIAGQHLDRMLRLLEEIAVYQRVGPGGAVLRSLDGSGKEFIVVHFQVRPVWGSVPRREVPEAVFGLGRIGDGSMLELNELKPHRALWDGSVWVDQGELFPGGVAGAIADRLPSFDQLSCQGIAAMMLESAGPSSLQFSTAHLLNVRWQIEQWTSAARNFQDTALDPLALLRPSSARDMTYDFNKTTTSESRREWVMRVDELDNTPELVVGKLRTSAGDYYDRLPGGPAINLRHGPEMVLRNPVSGDVYVVLVRQMKVMNPAHERIFLEADAYVRQLQLTLPPDTYQQVQAARARNRLHLIMANLTRATYHRQIKLMKFELPPYLSGS